MGTVNWQAEKKEEIRNACEGGAQFEYLTLKFNASRLTYSEEHLRAYLGHSLIYFI